MSRNYRVARLARKWKMTDVIDKLGISLPTLSAWEGERKAPGIENLEKMAGLYGVTTDYLLGRTAIEHPAATDAIPRESLPIFDGRPVWSAEHLLKVTHLDSFRSYCCKTYTPFPINMLYP